MQIFKDSEGCNRGRISRNVKSELPGEHLSGDMKNYSCMCESEIQARGLGWRNPLQVANMEVEFNLGRGGGEMGRG